MMQFVTDYINYSHGWTPHQRMITEWGNMNNPRNAFGPIRDALAKGKCDYLEQFVAIYSWLCNDNLAPLFNATGCFPVSEEKITSGLSIIQNLYDNLPSPKVTLGTNVVEAGSSSIAVHFAASPEHPLTSVEFTLAYDPARVSKTDVMLRDLSLIKGWKIESQEQIEANKVKVKLSGTKAISGIGSIAHIRFQIKPNSSGELPFQLLDINTNEGALPAQKGAIPLPDKPLFTTVTLPSSVVGQNYETSLSVIGGKPKYTWTLEEDNLPVGLKLNSDSGQISGSCTQAGKSMFRVKVTDASGKEHHRWFVMEVR